MVSEFVQRVAAGALLAFTVACSDSTNAVDPSGEAASGATLTSGGSEAPTVPLTGGATGGAEPPTSTGGAPTAQQTGGAETVPELPEGTLTYYQHLKPIIDAKCVRCHVEGTVAPFALDTYELASKYATFGQAAVNAGRMPPWLFEDDCNDYVGSLSLTDEQKAMFNTWVDQGAQEGDPNTPAPPLETDNLSLSREDVRLITPEPYTPQTTTAEPDDYRCFPVRWPEEYTSTMYMTGFRALPGNLNVVHHVEVYKVGPSEAAEAFQLDDADPGPGYECFGGPTVGDGTVGGWAPGGEGYDYPEGVGLAVEPGSVIIIQVHYNTAAGQPEPDQSGVAFRVDAQAIAGGYDFWTNPVWVGFKTMNIPAGNADVQHQYVADPTSLAGGRSVLLHTAALHMHNLGKSGHMYLRRPNGERKCIFVIDEWDFHWQMGVRFREPIEVHPGDVIEMECRFDNSAENQTVIAGVRPEPRDVNWGDGTADEMCLGVLLWSPLQ